MVAKQSIILLFVIFLTACALPSQVTPSLTAPSTPPPTAPPAAVELQKVETSPSDCSQMVQGLPAEGLAEVAYLPSGFCFHGELDIFETGGRVYVAQAVMSSFPNAGESFRIIDVTDAERPTLVGMWKWNAPTFSADVKAFRQGDRWFLALSKDPSLPDGASESTKDLICSRRGGIAIIEVTTPAEPKLITVLNGKNTGSEADWCLSHTAEVSRDADGNGAYLYVSATDLFDLRVLDIRDLDHVVEVGHYTHPDADFLNVENATYVHDTTIAGDRVYIAYWTAGLIILDRRALEAGEAVTPLNPPDSIKPEGLHIHYAAPTVDGNFVFVEDEFPPTGQESHLRLYDIRDLSSPKEVLAITLPDAFASPHNMVVAGDLLFVGWYQDGVRVFQYDTSDPNKPTVEPFAYKAVRSTKTYNPYSRDFDGIWGVRLHSCEVAGQAKTCIYATDISWGLLIFAMDPIESE